MGKKVLLYSGGMDSYIISKLEKFDILLYIDVKSRYSYIEKEFLKKQNIKNLVIDERLDLSDKEQESAIIPMRNLFFIMIATYYGDHIVLGATAGDRSFDKDLTFAKKTEDLLRYIYQKSWWSEGREIKVDLKYKNYSKYDLVKEFLKVGGTIEELEEKSFSCYNPINNKPCGRCKPCRRKWLFLLPFKRDLSNKDMVNFWINEYKSGKMDRGKESEDMVKIVEEIIL